MFKSLIQFCQKQDKLYLDTSIDQIQSLDKERHLKFEKVGENLENKISISEKVVNSITETTLELKN